MLGSIGVTVLAAALGGDGQFNFKEVKEQVFDREKKATPDIYTLGFMFRKPRYVAVNEAGQGRQLVWYMTYKVYSRDGQDRTFIPKFTLVTDKGKVHEDVILPRAQERVKLIEEPTRDLFNSVTVSGTPLPATPADATPRVRHGVVFFKDVDMADTKAFTLYVTGLSNGYRKIEVAGKGGERETKMERKTLELKFSKPGDDFYPDPKEIKLAGDPTWVYR